ncbi:Shedu immune nuclease family protein [Haladaptatus sp. NG-WS-4]
MRISQDFGNGEVYEIEVNHGESGPLNHIAHYPIKKGPRTYKSLNVFEVPEKDEDQYILGFWKARKNSGFLNQDEETEFRCSKEEVTRLLGFLENIYELKGLDRGNHVILKKESPSSEAAASAVEAIKSCEDDGLQDILLELIGSLTDLDVEIGALDLSSDKVERDAVKAEHAIKYARTKSILEEFRQKIEREEAESEYQEFLEDNPWLFGQEYVQQIELRELTRDEEVDFCFESVDGFFDVIEIKKPETTVLVEDGSHDTYKASAELSSAIAQVQNYIYRIEQAQGNILMRDGMNMVKPRGIIVIGDDLSSDERESLRVMNSHLNRITIHTFSDITKIGQRIVDRYDEDEELPVKEIREDDSE